MRQILRSLTSLGLICLTVISVRAQTLTSVTPNTVTAGSPAFTLTVDGADFVTGSIVRWNGDNRNTAFVSSTRLRALIPATDIATAGTASVTVINNPGGGISNALTITMANRVAASVSLASFTGPLAPESQVATFGARLATSFQAATTIPRPTSLAGTTVRVLDSAGVEQLAPLDLVSAGQVNHQMPAGTAVGMARVTVTSGDGTISIGNVQIAAVAPGLHSANASGRGVANGSLLRVRADGSQNFEPVAQFDSAQNRFVGRPIDLGPATDQVFLILYGTGFRFRSSLSAVSAKIGGEDAQVTYAGPSDATGSGLIFGPGLDEVRLRLPRSLTGRGEVNIEFTVDGKTANVVTVTFGGMRDTTPPSITGASASPSALWPPNHKMVNVTVNYNVTDNDTPSSAGACALSVTSNEPVNGAGDGDTAPDWEVVDAHHVRLRAERSGSGNGRVYTITITCTDNSGNSSVRTVTVRVPKSRS